jgi:hypothetical protein
MTGVRACLFFFAVAMLSPPGCARTKAISLFFLAIAPDSNSMFYKLSARKRDGGCGERSQRKLP